MTGARQTMLSWARVIDSVESLPEIYKNSCQTLIENVKPFPFMVLVPPQAGDWKRKPIERLLCDIHNTFYILESTGNQVVTTGYSYQDINRLELGNILLYSWFSINGKTIAGTNTVLTVEFNEASLRHFEPFLRKMRPAPILINPSEMIGEKAKLEYLLTENYKYLNFAQQSLVYGDKVIQSVYQPQINQPGLKVLERTFYHSLSLAHLTILTNREVILIGDAEGISEKKRNKYGGIQCYIPLHSLVSISMEDEPGGYLRLIFHVTPDEKFLKIFDASRMQEIENLKKSIEAVIV
jgi:hypothetical protein